jgi:hypothetical protein
MGATPGWYPDPSGAPGKRYFDGAQWAEQRVAPHKSTGKAWIWIVAAVVLTFGGCSLLMSNVAKQNTGDGHTPGTGGGSQPTTATAHLNEPVRDGKFEFTVTSVNPNQHGYFTVNVRVRNIGDGAQTLFAQNQKLIDGEGSTYDADTMAVYDFNQQSGGTVDLNPGLTTDMTIPFRVAPGATLTFVELHDSAFSGGAKVSLAGAG